MASQRRNKPPPSAPPGAVLLDRRMGGPLGRRRHLRIPVNLWAEEVGGELGDERYLHYCTDLSAGGVFLENKLPFPPGAAVQLNLDLDDEQEALQVRGRVVNVRGLLDGDQLVGNGIEFVELAAADKERIERALERIAEGLAEDKNDEGRE